MHNPCGGRDVIGRVRRIGMPTGSPRRPAQVEKDRVRTARHAEGPRHPEMSGACWMLRDYFAAMT